MRAAAGASLGAALGDRGVALGRVCSGLAHQLNNPLAGVLTNIEFALEAVREAGERDPDVVAALADARDGALRLRDIVRDLGIFGRADDGRIGPVELPAVAEAAIQIAWNELRHRTVLRRDYGPTPAVEANEPRLVQVALNLLLNAIAAIPETAPETEAREVCVRIAAHPDGALLEVADTGVGIAAADLDHIFDPFFTTRAGQGRLGLGLSICRYFVESWGGAIEVASEPGRGSVFRVVLPASARPVAAVAAVAAAPVVAPTRRARVLVIDDEHDVLRAVQRALAFDHDVVALDDAARSLALLAAGERFDIILCDLMMPRMSGVEFYDEVAALSPALARSVVIVTGGAFTPRTVEFLTRVRHVEKPLTIGALRQLIASALVS